MKKRIFGIETEYGCLIEKNGGGYAHEFNAVACFFYQLWLAQYGSVLERFYPFALNEGEFWLGSNGAKLYNDLDHIEYSSPECLSFKDVVLYDFAGDHIVSSITKRFAFSGAKDFGKKGGYKGFFVTKNNSDFVRPITDYSEAIHFYGSHENYLAQSRIFIPDSEASVRLSREIFPSFLASRVIYHGAGGFRCDNNRWKYVVSPKAFTIQRLTGGTTQSDRPLVDTRGIDPESEHAGRGMVRLHLIYSDSNMSHFSTYMRFMTTHLVLRVLEERGGRLKSSFPVFEDPIEALRIFAGDAKVKLKARTVGGKNLGAADIQKFFIEEADKLVLSKEEKGGHKYWADVNERMMKDPESLNRELDWVIKDNAMRLSMKKNAYGMQSPKARVFDVRYHDISDKGIFNIMRAGGLVDVMFSASEIEKAANNPPRGTRAKVRAMAIRAYKERNDNVYIGWDAVELGKMFKLDLKDYFSSNNAKLSRILKKNGF